MPRNTVGLLQHLFFVFANKDDDDPVDHLYNLADHGLSNRRLLLFDFLNVGESSKLETRK
jgi:hypothetical protein